MMMPAIRFVGFLAAVAFAAGQGDLTSSNSTVTLNTTDGPSLQICSFNPCVNGGVCQVEAGDSSYSCLCPYGFGGVICELEVPTTTMHTTNPPCSFNPCYNNGTCEIRNEHYFCVCPSTHTGLVCQNEVTTAATTPLPTAPTPVCPSSNINKNNLGCQPAEVVFLLEYGVDDSRVSVDHEGDFIKELIGHWGVSSREMQVGVVTYHDTVQDAIHLGKVNQDRVLLGMISSLTRRLRPSGEPDLANALYFTRNNSFQGARPNIPRVVIPIVHQMPGQPDKLSSIVDAAKVLKDECITIIPFGVRGRYYNSTITSLMATQPAEDHLVTLNQFDDLEDHGDDYRKQCDALVG